MGCCNVLSWAYRAARGGCDYYRKTAGRRSTTSCSALLKNQKSTITAFRNAKYWIPAACGGRGGRSYAERHCRLIKSCCRSIGKVAPAFKESCASMISQLKTLGKGHCLTYIKTVRRIGQIVVKQGKKVPKGCR